MTGARWYVTRDGARVAGPFADDFGCAAWVHAHTSGSVHHATTHEGYAFEQSNDSAPDPARKGQSMNTTNDTSKGTPVLRAPSVWCADCGSPDVDALEWVHQRTNTPTGDEGPDTAPGNAHGNTWCGWCANHRGDGNAPGLTIDEPLAHVPTARRWAARVVNAWRYHVRDAIAVSIAEESAYTASGVLRILERDARPNVWVFLRGHKCDDGVAEYAGELLEEVPEEFRANDWYGRDGTAPTERVARETLDAVAWRGDKRAAWVRREFERAARVREPDGRPSDPVR